MSSISEPEMRQYLSRSISSLNENKLRGLLAEVDFRTHLTNLGFGDRISRGGWIARRIGAGEFAHETAVFFPETIKPDESYPVGRDLPAPDVGLHTICATFHQTGIASYFCAATVPEDGNPEGIQWYSTQLGLPAQQPYQAFPESVGNLFTARPRRYNFLRHHAEADRIPDAAIAEEFSKENLRVMFQNVFFCEPSDVDGILWGRQYTYPVEIKEKTPANDRKVGDYFGLDVGPFVKLAHYAARKGNLHSIFVVREIDNVNERNLVDWWFITFEQLALFASWVPREGGPAMGGGRSSTVIVPKTEFQRLTRESLAAL